MKIMNGGKSEFGFDPSKYLVSGAFVLIVLILIFGSTYIIQPGHRGVSVTLGKASPHFLPEGFGLKVPFITTIIPISIRQQTTALRADCYSSDLQQVTVQLGVLYRIPEGSVVPIYTEYAGDPFVALIAPRISEAIKEVTALQSAESIVKKREEIKSRSLALAREKIGTILFIEDMVIQDISLSKELEAAIEAKMVQEQEAAKAKFTQQKTQIEADTAIIRARGEAESIRIRGQALRESPNLIQLQIVEKWDGKSPLVVGGGTGGGANILMPIGDLRRQ